MKHYYSVCFYLLYQVQFGTTQFCPRLTFPFSQIALDTCGIVAGWKIFDHAAHLGGMIFGVWWFQEGSKIIWGRREVIMRWWHENVRNREGKS